MYYTAQDGRKLLRVQVTQYNMYKSQKMEDLQSMLRALRQCDLQADEMARALKAIAIA
jgi:hypothetical protein